MNRTVYLIRHGEIENPKNIVYGSNIEMELSNKGREQIRHLAQKIKDSGEVPSKIISSTLKRAVESSEILSSVWGAVEIEQDEGLKDSFVPAVAGKPMSFLEDLYKKGTDEYSGEFLEQGNESREHIADRMLHVYKKAASLNLDCVALLSHGDPILFLMYKLLEPDAEIPPINRAETKVEYLSKGHAWKLTVDKDGNLLEQEVVSPE